MRIKPKNDNLIKDRITELKGSNDTRTPKSTKSLLESKGGGLNSKSATKKKVKSKKKPEKLSTLIKKLDKVFSQFIRLRDTDENGNGNCCTCEKGTPYKEGEAGHFIVRGRHATRWEEMNVNMQCHYCNNRHWGGGKPFEHSLYIDRKYGMSELLDEDSGQLLRFSEALHNKGKEIFKPGKPWLREQIEIYKEKVKELLKNKNFTI